MKYTDPKLQSLLAAEYVLGSLQGQARRRFERLLSTEPGMREAVEYWQYRLNPLAETMGAVTPPKRVWQGIQARVRGESASANSSWLSSLGDKWWNNTDFWRGASFASIALLVGLLVTRPDSTSVSAPDATPFNPSEYVAVLQNEQARPMLVASMDNETLRLDMLEEAKMPANQVMEVWCIPKEGMPMSLGKFDSEAGRFHLSLDQIQSLHDAAEIAISIEPVGGSIDKTGPSGPIKYRGTIL